MKLYEFLASLLSKVRLFRETKKGVFVIPNGKGDNELCIIPTRFGKSRVLEERLAQSIVQKTPEKRSCGER